MNIPSLSARTIQHDIASGPFSIGANIQVRVHTCILGHVSDSALCTSIACLTSLPPLSLSLSLSRSLNVAGNIG